MFQGCTSLTEAPLLHEPSTHVDDSLKTASGCYVNMFSGCTSLTITNDEFNFGNFFGTRRNTILERNTDNSINDDIVSGIRCEKDYYIGKNLIHKEKEFDSRIEYTFISKEMENKEYKCPNCGMQSKLKDFVDGCPYCRTYYNIDYSDKDLGSKYHYDRVLRNNTYRIVTGIVDLIISFILCAIFIKFMKKRGFKSRFVYWFDNLMSKGTGMMDKVHCVQRANNGGRIIFATGTPITNSITDIFVIPLLVQK